jgi:hypothetical protein
VRWLAGGWNAKSITSTATKQHNTTQHNTTQQLETIPLFFSGCNKHRKEVVLSKHHLSGKEKRTT